MCKTDKSPDSPGIRGGDVVRFRDGSRRKVALPDGEPVGRFAVPCGPELPPCDCAECQADRMGSGQ